MANLKVVDKKSLPAKDPRSHHIDEWERVSDEFRDKQLGDVFYDEMEAFYQLVDNGGPSPTFRPQIQIPELQSLMLQEANDLSEASPQVYILDNSANDRDKDREKSFQAAWAGAQTNFHIMFAQLHGLFAGTGFLQVGYDPDARNGKGQLWVKARNPRSVFCDPGTSYELDWTYSGWTDYLYIEQIRKKWPITGQSVRPRAATQTSSSTIGAGTYGFQMPEGPMSTIGGINKGPNSTISDNRLAVRYTFCDDYTTEAAQDKSIPDGAITRPSTRYKYPNGRMIVDCEGVVLADGDNPFPLRYNPLIPYWAIPPLFSIWGVPATRFTQGMQFISQRLFTGVFENATRLNNGVWFIDERTGINPESFGGLPGEVQVINSNSPPPTCVWPGQMPAHFTQVPAMMFEMQRRIQGFTPARQGQPGDGNISPELFDESILRAQGITQLRGRLAAYSTQRLAELMFYTMARYQRRMKFPYSDPSTGFSLVDWKAIDRPDQYDIFLDPASIAPMSQTMLRKLVPQLIELGVLPPRRALATLGFPHADEISNEQDQNLALQALANAKRGKR